MWFKPLKRIFTSQDNFLHEYNTRTRLLLLLASLGVILFLLATSTLAFKGGLFGLLFSKAFSYAATNNTAVEAESGALANGAVVLSDSTASVGKFVQLGTAPSPIPTIPPGSSSLPAIPLISRNVPSYNSSNIYSGSSARFANDDSLDSQWRSSGTPAWIAYDLSGVPVSQRQQALGVWYNFSYSYNTIHGSHYDNLGSYTIEGNSAPGGGQPPSSGWTTLVSVNSNTLHSRQHLFNLNGANWVRLNVSSSDGSSQNYDADVSTFDIYDLSATKPSSITTPNDDWMFYGDSITANCMTTYSGNGVGSYEDLIHQADPTRWPVAENGGEPFDKSFDGVQRILGPSGTGSDGYLGLFPGKYVILSYGMNDSAGGGAQVGFYNNMAQLVQAVHAAGKIPVIATIDYTNDSTHNSNIPAYNAEIAQLYTNFHYVVKGPDFWTFFSQNQSLINPGDIHPNSAGCAAMRQQWANLMLSSVYQATGSPTPTPTVTPSPTPSPIPSPTSSPTPSPTPVALNGIHVSGNKLVNSAGTTIRLLGVNHSGTEYACAQAGSASTGYGWGLNDHFLTQTDVYGITTWHANVVRIPLNEDCWLGINNIKSDYSGANYQNNILSLVSNINQAGLYVILDLHWSAPGSIVPLTQQSLPDADHSIAFWQSVANTFKGNQNVIFDLFNEPFIYGNETTSNNAWGCWLNGCQMTVVRSGGSPYQFNQNWQSAGMNQLIATVRSTGATNLIMAGGLDWANDLSGWGTHVPTDPANNLAVSWHNYGTEVCSPVSPSGVVDETCWNNVVAPLAQTYPIVTGETGDSVCSSANFETTFLPWADQHGLSYLGWTWNAWQDCGNVLVTSYGTAANPTANPPTPYIPPTPTTNYGQFFHDHLIQVAPTQSVLGASAKAVGGSTRVLGTATKVLGASNTVVGISGTSFTINGQVTSPGTAAQGLLMNSRMIQGIFDDENSQTKGHWAYPDTHVWDPSRNTNELVAAMPSYAQKGLKLITIGMQGGCPRCDSSNGTNITTGFNSDGSLKPAWMSRLDQVIRAADQHGIVVQVSLFYFKQDSRVNGVVNGVQVMSSQQAHINAINNLIDWVEAGGYTNVTIELANELDIGGFDSYLKNNTDQIIKNMQARSVADGRRLMISVSYLPHTVTGSVAADEDYINLHGNGQGPSTISSWANSEKSFGKPVMYDEDSTSTANTSAAVSAGASWGYYDQGSNDYINGYQSPPTNWQINTGAKQGFFNLVAGITGTPTPPPSPTPTPVPGTTTVDDGVLGSGQNQFNYTGSWSHCPSCEPTAYQTSNSWSNTTNDSVTVAFTGVQIKLYGVQDPGHGIGAVSIDGGAESNVDFYSSFRKGNVLLWTSPVLASGPHTFKLRVSGTKNPSSGGTYVVPDRVDRLDGSGGVSTPIPTPTATATATASPTPLPTPSCMTALSNQGATDTVLAVIPATGDYTFWSRLKSSTSSVNSYWLQVDNLCVYQIGGSSSMPANAWTWVNYQGGNTTSPVVLHLTAGSHSFALVEKDASLGIDRVLLTIDNCIPTDTGDNCILSPTPTPTATPTPIPGTITIDDGTLGTGLNQMNYHGSWSHCPSCEPTAYQTSNSWSNTTNDTLMISFNGAQVKFYGVQDPQHGIGAVSIDGGTESNVDFYSSVRHGNVLLWTSPVLPVGSHTFKLRVTGTKNPSSAGYYAVPDRVDILANGGVPTPTPTIAPTPLPGHQSVNSFSLINSDTNQPVQGYDPLVDQTILNLTQLPAHLNIRANTNPAVVGSVMFGYDSNPTYHLENSVPYSFAGDNNGVYNQWVPSVGQHRITATPYTATGASETAGTALTINITVTNVFAPTPQPMPIGPQVVNFTLINADTNQPISGFDPIPASTTINISQLPTNHLNIRANIGSTAVGSVMFSYDGNPTYHLENTAPYSFAGDNNGQYYSWTPTSGTHTLVGTAYSKSGASGLASPATTLVFTIR